MTNWLSANPFGDPGPRPSDPSQISFDEECFETVGEEVEYVVVLSAPHYPRRFTDREEAERFARKVNRQVVERRTPVRRRICWTKK